MLFLSDIKRSIAMECEDNSSKTWRQTGLEWGKMFIDIVFFLVCVLCVGGILITLSAYGRMQLSEGNADASSLWGMIADELMVLLSVFAGARFILWYRKLPLSLLGLSFRLRPSLYGCLLAVLLYAISFSFSLLSGSIYIDAVGFYPLSLVGSFVFFLLVGFTEELMMRGFVLGRMLVGGMNRWTALTCSSLLFSLMHWQNPGFTLLPFLNIFLAGVLMGLPYLYTRNLSLSVSLHVFWNWLQGPVLGYQVSGTESSVTHSVFDIRFSEPDLVNGGDFGFEGSVLCTCLLIVSIVLVRIYGPRFLRQAPPLSAR